MLLETSQITKKLVGKLDPGKELITSLSDVCRAHAIGSGTIEVYGSLSAVELIGYQKGADAVPLHNGKGSFTILSFSGNISMYGSEIVVDTRCVLSANGPLGFQMLGGVIKSATIESIDIVLSGFDDLVVERQPNFKEGRFTIEGFRKKSASKSHSLNTPSSTAPVVEERAESIPEVQSELSWDDAAELTPQKSSKKRLVPRHERISDAKAELAEIEDEADSNMELSPGDLLLHPKLGECRVMKVEGDEFARVRLPKGQLRKLSLAICVPVFVETKNGRNIFKVQIN